MGPIFVGAWLLAASLLTLLERGQPDSKIGHFGDAAWFCVVTMSTVGYGDVYPVTAGGRVVVACFILFTLVTVGFLLTAVSEAVLEVKRMEDLGLNGTRMAGHVVVCGMGPLARTALSELLAAGRPVALLCSSQEQLAAARQIGEKGRLFVTLGEPTQEVLRDRLNTAAAEAAVVAYADDAENLIAALNLRAVAPQARVVVALQREELRQTVIAGGVTYAASPYEFAGRLVASAAFEPEVAQLIEDMASGVVGSHDTEQYLPGRLAGLTVGEIRGKLEGIDGPLLLGVAQQRGERYAVLPHPARDLRIGERDQLLVLGTVEQGQRMRDQFGSLRPGEA